MFEAIGNWYWHECSKAEKQLREELKKMRV